ncbi:C2H2 type zinc-finger-domain-containing protein [Flagelloscypha sp. PMI_526]|nr:C2H2 type zinc-finger-domain-containing protein [Flagelloscypha sp. PMI_526]
MSDKASEPMFTCISCTIVFPSAEDQRTHYRSDHHRYNMKRRVAGLPPISAALFNQKVLDRRADTAIMSSPKGSICHVCNKTYTTENAYRSHVNSKKHKENELKAATKPSPPILQDEAEPELPAEDSTPPTTLSSQGATLTVDPNADEETINRTIDEKIAAARSKLSPAHCLFCPHESRSLESNLTHMSSFHSFFIPDAEFLIDIDGLIRYLGEKIAIGNVCIFCNGKGREFRTLDAVRKHMVDKVHCKIAYDREKDRLEVSDYYDFSSSYPVSRRKHTDDEDGDADEIIEVEAEEEDESDDDEDDLPETGLVMDGPYELVLPSGARLLHKSLHKAYRREVNAVTRQTPSLTEEKTGVALVRELLRQKNSALVPRKGALGAFGTGAELVRARNAGEAREAGRHVKEFRDVKKRENFKTKVAFRNNNQKHFRDPRMFFFSSNFDCSFAHPSLVLQ